MSATEMIVLVCSEDGLVLLAPVQMYVFDAAGRECHEFVRYRTDLRGRILKQKIVKRVYIPGEGGQ